MADRSPAGPLAAAGLIVFALCAHRPLPLLAAGVAGLVAAAIALGRSLARASSPLRLFGLTPLRPSTAAFAALGCAVGAALAAAFRAWLRWPLLPVAPLRPFALIACLIGVAEELVYRGWLQGEARPLGPPGAALAAAAAHALYKAALFALPAEGQPGNPAFVFAFTLAGGLAFGVLREISQSVAPPLCAHAVFDLAAYGTQASAPWWVWG